MKVIFKIVEYLPETKQVVVKFCRQNAPKPIDDYCPIAINTDFIDVRDNVNLIESLFQIGMYQIEEQERAETTLDENVSNVGMNIEPSFETLVNKVVSIDTNELTPTSSKSRRLKRIDIE